MKKVHIFFSGRRISACTKTKEKITKIPWYNCQLMCSGVQYGLIGAFYSLCFDLCMYVYVSGAPHQLNVAPIIKIPILSVRSSSSFVRPSTSWISSKLLVIFETFGSHCHQKKRRKTNKRKREIEKNKNWYCDRVSSQSKCSNSKKVERSLKKIFSFLDEKLFWFFHTHVKKSERKRRRRRKKSLKRKVMNKSEWHCERCACGLHVRERERKRDEESFAIATFVNQVICFARVCVFGDGRTDEWTSGQISWPKN